MTTHKSNTASAIDRLVRTEADVIVEQARQMIVQSKIVVQDSRRIVKFMRSRLRSTQEGPVE